MRNDVRWRRSSIAVLSTLAIGGAALAFTGAPATARPVEPAAAPAAAQAVSSGNQVSKEAWAAGRAKYGANVTAAQALAAYWTPARMAAAKPIEESESYKAAIKRLDAMGVPEVAPNVGPATQVKPAPGAVKYTGGTVSPMAANPNFPVGHPTGRTSGKAFFNTPFGGGACSGTIINSEGGNTVWTAGHCVNQGAGGAWFTNWVFVPNYDIDLANPAPYGTWTSNALWSLCGWTCPGWGDFTYDMAVAIMNTNFGGWHIVHYLGGQGLRINYGVGQWENSFGYPSEPPFSGGHLWQCWGSNFWEVVNGTTQIPCDMNRGSSGGGWLHGWDGNWGYLNGVNSRVDRLPGPTLMKAPYFDNDALTLYNATRNL
jgi:hypothetical protein